MAVNAPATTDKLRPGDVFTFGPDTLLERIVTVDPDLMELFLKANRFARKRSANQVELYYKPRETAEYVVVASQPTTGGDHMGRDDENGGWRVSAAPRGTALEALAEETVTFIQFGPYRVSARPDVFLTRKARKPLVQCTAIRG